MSAYIEPIGRLINQFTKLPGVGTKTAQRYAYKVINMTEEEAAEFAECILKAKKKCIIAAFAEIIPIRTFAISVPRVTVRLFA